MRVITGTARGKHLKTADGNDVRPTPERVKEALFSAIHFDIEGRSFLDLFAGSGQMGIEALSRGADFCLFADVSSQSVGFITDNVENTGFKDKSKIIRGDYSAVIQGMDRKFDFAFLDPPYSSGLLLPAAKLVCRVMNPYGIIICEHPKEQEMPDIINDFSRNKIYRYGKVCLSVYRRETS